MSPPNIPRITSCGCLYCESCLEDLADQAASENKTETTCSKCGLGFSGSEHFHENINDARQSAENSKKNGGKSQTPKALSPARRWEWLKELGKDIPVSAKTTAAKLQISNWIHDDPDAKVIVFTQWTGMMFILSEIFIHEGWHPIKYYGMMSVQQKEAAVKEFESHRGSCVMISNMSCGGVGLNLTMASYVVILDLWWNQALEDQAFGRVYRIGQTRMTSLTRFFADQTMDEHVRRIQEKKKQSIAEIMSGKDSKVSQKELLEIFGKVVEKDGKMFISEVHEYEEDTIFEDGAYHNWEKYHQKSFFDKD